MAITYWPAKGLIGGATNDLDKIDGATPVDLDVAFTEENGVSYRHQLDADSADTEQEPAIIQPDANGGNKRWVLMPDTIDIRRGFCVRPQFTWKDADEIYIGPGAYHTFDGTNHRIVYWQSQLTYTVSSLAASDWSYIYLDESAIDTLVGIAGAGLLTTTQLTDSVTEPAWSHAKGGWYNSSDRCIGAVYTDGSSNILEFEHDGDTVFFGDAIASQAAVDIDTTWTDINALHIPKFATLGVVSFTEGAASGSWYWRTNGSASTSGTPATGGQQAERYVNVITDASQLREMKCSASGANTIAVETLGWKFPVGM